MSVELHDRAMQVAADAGERARAGDAEGSRALLVEAANLEAQAYELIPGERRRTRGAIAVSAVSLWLQAGDERMAAALAARVLAADDLPEAARTELVNVIVDTQRRRQAASSGRVSALGSFEVALRGPDIRVAGAVPLETVLLKMDQFRNYIFRVGELVLQLPFRTSRAASELADSIVPIVSPATIGSYRFELGVELLPEQLTLVSERRRIDPDEIAARAFEIIDEAVTSPDTLGERVREPLYTDWFTRSIRGLAPTGKGLNEIEVSRPATRSSTKLLPESGKQLDRLIQAARRAARKDLASQPQEVEALGKLRAVHLDKGWVVVVDERGAEHQFDIGAGVFDDVIGPLVNHRVKIAATREGRNLVAQDIVEAE
ncbi:MAG TPA: hypothetical protein VFC31_00315 [Candidatus Limnocylindria bacterium]|nr:hypothetical protein [Candidatus Limnocylindria bacterium]